MLQLIQDLAKDPDLRDEFADDCEAVISRYELAENEKRLLRSRNSSSIEAYLKNGSGAAAVYAATTVVVSQVVQVQACTVAQVQVVIVAAAHDHPDDQGGALFHKAYWQRVATRAQSLVHGG
jgi:hypothetical protein